MKNSISYLDIELNKIFESLDTTSCIKVSFILSKLDLSKFSKKSYSKYPTEAICKLYIYKRIKGLTNHYEKVLDYFLENPEEALELGFFKNINNNIIFPPKRTYNHYLKNKINNQLKQLDSIAEKVLTLANKHKILLDLEIVKKTLKN
ncbi:MAG: hypothetical protein AABX08_00845, partial [Nanoarchaeota archaeon]